MRIAPVGPEQQHRSLVKHKPDERLYPSLSGFSLQGGFQRNMVGNFGKESNPGRHSKTQADGWNAGHLPKPASHWPSNRAVRLEAAPFHSREHSLPWAARQGGTLAGGQPGRLSPHGQWSAIRRRLTA